MLKQLLEFEYNEYEKAIAAKTSASSNVKKRIPTREEEIRALPTTDDFAAGCFILDQVNGYLHRFDDGLDGIRRSPEQQKIQHLILSGMIPTFFGPKSAFYEPEIRARYGFTDMTKAIGIMMGRRMGKTTSIVMLCVALLLSVPNIVILVIAQVSRTAVMFNEQIANLLKRCFGITHLHIQNQDCIGLKFSETDIRKVFALPGSATDNLRGIGGHVVILEEAAFVPHKTYTSVVLPILRKENTCLVAISTLNYDAGNYFNKMIRQGIIQIHKTSLVCEKCEAAGARDVCVHNRGLLPFWLSEENEDLIRKLNDDPESYERELLGLEQVSNANMRFVFPQHLVERFIAFPRISFYKPVRYVLVVVDPVSGSKVAETRLSDFVITTVTYPQLVLLGLEALDVNRRRDYEPTLLDHLKKIRQTKHCEECKFILDVETGTGLSVSDIQEFVLKNFMGVYTVDDLNKRKPGTLTTATAKEEMAQATLEALDNERVTIAKEFITSSKPDEILQEFSKQMQAYERIVKPNTSRVLFSGKGENGKKRDDLAVTFQRAIRLADRVRTKLKFLI